MTKATGKKVWDSRLKHEDLLWSKVDKRGPDECWNWKGSKCSKGYGQMGWNWKVKRAHRISAIIAFGDKPNMHVLHSCDNPSCCNPSHLRWGNNAENMQDRNKRNASWRKKVASAGRDNGIKLRKLPQSSVDYCRMLLKSGYTQTQCAKWYDISKTTMPLIANNKRY